MALLTTIRDRQKTARQAANLFVRDNFPGRTVDEKWDGDKFRLVGGVNWYRAEIVKDGIAIHLEGGGT